MLHVGLLIVCAVAIYLSCEWFVNAVEWLGQRLRVGPLAVGTVLAAFGTALPESVVTFVAVVLGSGEKTKDIGVGAALGGPLVLATVSYGVTGLAMLARQRRQVRASTPMTGAGQSTASQSTASQSTTGHGTTGHGTAGHGLTGLAVASGVPTGGFGDPGKLARDQTWFLTIFVVKVALGLVAFAIKPWLGLAFFAAYGVYFWRELRADGDGGGHGELEPLLLQRRRPVPATWAVIAQTLGTLAIIFGASQLFVRQLDAIGPMIGLPAAVTALLLSPIATELPETMNAIIWVRQGKTPLALANISGAMMIQATVPSGLGLLFTPWRFDAALLVAGLVTMAAIGYLLILLRRRALTPGRLAWAAGFYLIFAGLLAWFG